MALTLATAAENWPIAGSFAISRGAKTEAVVVVAELGDGKARGRGECVPYTRYGETVDSVMTQIEALEARLAAGLDRQALQDAMPAGAARNALDCAFWDLEAKTQWAPGSRARRPARARTPSPPPTRSRWRRPTSWPRPPPRSPHRPCSRSSSAATANGGDAARIAAVRAAAPRATLIVDANEGWDERQS